MIYSINVCKCMYLYIQWRIEINLMGANNEYTYIIVCIVCVCPKHGKIVTKNDYNCSAINIQFFGFVWLGSVIFLDTYYLLCPRQSCYFLCSTIRLSSLTTTTTPFVIIIIADFYYYKWLDYHPSLQNFQLDLNCEICISFSAITCVKQPIVFT